VPGQVEITCSKMALDALRGPERKTQVRLGTTLVLTPTRGMVKKKFDLVTWVAACR